MKGGENREDVGVSREEEREKRGPNKYINWEKITTMAARTHLY